MIGFTGANFIGSTHFTGQVYQLLPRDKIGCYNRAPCWQREKDGYTVIETVQTRKNSDKHLFLSNQNHLMVTYNIKILGRTLPPQQLSLPLNIGKNSSWRKTISKAKHQKITKTTMICLTGASRMSKIQFCERPTTTTYSSFSRSSLISLIMSSIRRIVIAASVANWDGEKL